MTIIQWKRRKAMGRGPEERRVGKFVRGKELVREPGKVASIESFFIKF